MEKAYERAGRDPRDTSYIEMHATGTAAGDPMEASWVADHFKKNMATKCNPMVNHFRNDKS